MTARAEEPVPRRIDIAGHAFELRDLVPDDAAALVALHRRVFGEGASDAWYEWKYVRGGGFGTGMWHEGQLVAHCAGLPRALRVRGESRSGIQIGDVMVTPEWRGILTRRGPFFHVSQAFYDAHVGAGREHTIAFGFPSDRHLRLAVKSKLLHDGGPVHGLTWNLATARPQLGWRWAAVPLDERDARFDATVERAWRRMLAACGGQVLGERTTAYVRWRFFERPGRTYRAIALRDRWLGGAAGVAILDLTGEAAQWLDWIGRPVDLPPAWAACAQAAQRAGAKRLTMWASPAVAQSLTPTRIEHTAVAAWIGIPCRSDIAESDLARLDWWLTGGDTDFL
ncbi:MAG TPA: GNAT family N-acetyltransferase [Ramlibacter sp.]|uniref:GNAT family N-acetyltransferase n=1 Tax=Ramlibacter sp. TaxID=1917967 RepID=UPI002C6A6C51|nr:GNAT family N-acetyltransferase [Ramlibacter sp.]HVZ46402.1 GNAT family N-acetyltransferase [Ramlibacter sp.]